MRETIVTKVINNNTSWFLYVGTYLLPGSRAGSTNFSRGGKLYFWRPPSWYTVTDQNLRKILIRLNYETFSIDIQGVSKVDRPPLLKSLRDKGKNHSFWELYIFCEDLKYSNFVQVGMRKTCAIRTKFLIRNPLFELQIPVRHKILWAFDPSIDLFWRAQPVHRASKVAQPLD